MKIRSLQKKLVGVLTAGLLMATTACGGGASSSAEGTGGGTLVIGMTASDIPLLDTGMSQNQGYEGIRWVGNQLYDGLTRFDLQQSKEIPKIVPGLATEWSHNADGSSWTFKLRPDVKFHDGEPWNAEAAVFNFDRYVNKKSEYYYPELNAQASASVSGIKSVTKVDDMTIQIDTDGPLSWLPNNMATIFFASPKAVKNLGKEGFALHPVGTGPFKFESYERGQQLAVTANKDYWGGRPKVDRVVFRPIPDVTARVAALRSGQVNWIEVPSPDDVPSLKADGFQVLTNSYNHSWPWVLDVTKGPLADVRVRQAMNYAIDRDAMVNGLLKGTAEPMLQNDARADPAYRPENDLYSYDPKKAKALLAEAGYANGISVRLSYPTSGSGNMLPTPMNQALKQDLAAVGINVTLEPVEWASMLTDFFSGRIPGGADMVNISLSMQQEGFWEFWFGSGSPSNAGKYSNPKVDSLLKQAKATLDDNARNKIYTQVVTLLTADAAWLDVVSDMNPRVLAPNVHGFIQPKSWFADLTTVTVG
jgi:peptide/nickel transport system substrate-binding protein